MSSRDFLEELTDAEMESHWFRCIGIYNTANEVVSKILGRYPYEVVSSNFAALRDATANLEEAQEEMARRAMAKARGMQGPAPEEED